MNTLLFFLALSCCVSLVDSASSCLTTLNELSQLEKAVTNFSTRRTYTLCSNTMFIVGRYDYSYNLVEGQDPLVVRPNLYLKCGANGDRSNQCLMTNGDILIRDAVTPNDPSQGPVILQGLTLIDAGEHMVKFTQPNEVYFVDCEFRQATRSRVPFLLDYYNPPISGQTQPLSNQLHVAFYGCSFLNNAFKGAMAQPSLIAATNLQVSLSLHGCHFTNNDFVTNNTVSERNSFLIDSSGPLELTNNCFSFNAVGVSPVVSYFSDASAVIFSQNFAEVSSGAVCPFVSHFETTQQYKTNSPFCHDFDSLSCQAATTSWSLPPTKEPTTSPTTPPNLPTSTPPPSRQPATPVPTRSQQIGTSATPTSPPTTAEPPRESETPSSSMRLFPCLVVMTGILLVVFECT